MPEIYSYSAIVTVGSSRLRVRAAPNTAAPLAGSQILDPGVKVKVIGWCYGECVEGECRWWVSQYGNYFWAGGTIEKPPGSPTPPTPAPPPAAPPPTYPTAPTTPPPEKREYEVSAPHVAFSQVLPVTFYPEDIIEIRAFNIDDIARVYVDDKLVLTVGFKGDQKVKINPGLSIGTHTIRLTVENTGGGWTYGFDILKNGASVLAAPFKEGEAGIKGAKDDDLGIGLVVDIRLGITISPPPQVNQEALEWFTQTQSQMLNEYAQTTAPFISEEELKRLTGATKVLVELQDIAGKAIFEVFERLQAFATKLGAVPFIFLLSTIPFYPKGAAQTILSKSTGAIVPKIPEAREIVPYIPDLADYLEILIAQAASFLLAIYKFYLFIFYAAIFPIVGSIQFALFLKNIRFYLNPLARIKEVIESAHEITRQKLDVVASKIDVVAEKIDVVRKDIDPLIRIVPEIQKLPAEISTLRISPEEIGKKVREEVKPIITYWSTFLPSFVALSGTISSISAQLPQIHSDLKSSFSDELKRLLATMTMALIDAKMQLRQTIPSETIGRIAQGLTDRGLIETGFSIFSEVVQRVMIAGMILEALKLWREEKSIFDSPIEKTLEWVYDLGEGVSSLVLVPKPVDKDTFKEKMRRPLSLALLAWLFQIVLGKFAGWLSAPTLDELSALIAPFASFRIISSRAIAAFADPAFTRPFRYGGNMAFPTEIPTTGEVLWWHARGILEPSQWELARRLYGDKALKQPELTPEAIDLVLRMRGFSEKYVEALKVRAFRPIDPFSFAFLCQTGYFVQEEIEFLTRDMGYRPEVRDYLVKAPMMWGLSPFKTSIRTRMFNAISDGFIEEEKAVRILEKLWKILDMRSIMTLEAQIRYWYETTKEKVDQLMDKATKEAITEEELRRELSTGPSIHISALVRGEERIEEDLEMRVVNPEKLESYIERVRIRKLRKPLEERIPEQKRFILGVLISLYKEGKYDERKFVETLEKADKITDFIELAKLRADLARELDEFLEEQKRQKEELKNYLSLIAGVLVSLYREGAISLNVLETRLTEAEGIKDRKLAYIKKAEYERELEEFLERKKEEKEKVKDYLSIVASILVECYEEGAITKDRLDTELELAEQITSKRIAYALKAQWARFLREFREQKKLEEEKVKEYLGVVASSIINCFEKGHIDYDTMVSELEFVESVTDKKVAYALKGLWERFYYQTEQKIDRLRDSLDAGLITEGSFYEELSRMGIEEWRIEQEIEAHEIKTYGKAISVEAKWVSEYRATIRILEKIKQAGFMTVQQVAFQIDEIKRMISPLEILRRRRFLETFYDTQKIKIEVLAEQFFIDLITEAHLYEELKKIIVVPEILEKTFLLLKAEREKRAAAPS